MPLKVLRVDAMIAGADELFNRQLRIAEVGERGRVAGRHAVVARLEQFVGPELIPKLAHPTDVVGIHAAIPEPDERVEVQALVAERIQPADWYWPSTP